MPTTDPEQLLRGVGLRVTQPRLAVLSALAERPHADTETIAIATRAALGAVSTQAVYDVLRALTDAGLARRIEPAGSPARFELRVGDNHHHVVWRAGGTGAAGGCAVGQPPWRPAAAHPRVVVDEAEVTYWGLCPSCSATTS